MRGEKCHFSVHRVKRNGDSLWQRCFQMLSDEEDDSVLVALVRPSQNCQPRQDTLLKLFDGKEHDRAPEITGTLRPGPRTPLLSPVAILPGTRPLMATARFLPRHGCFLGNVSILRDERRLH